MNNQQAGSPIIIPKIIPGVFNHSSAVTDILEKKLSEIGDVSCCNEK